MPPTEAAAFAAAVLVKVAAAHARGLHLDDDLAGPGRGIGKLHQLDLSFAEEHDAAHECLPTILLKDHHFTPARRVGVGAGRRLGSRATSAAADFVYGDADTFVAPLVRIS